MCRSAGGVIVTPLLPTPWFRVRVRRERLKDSALSDGPSVGRRLKSHGAAPTPARVSEYAGCIDLVLAIAQFPMHSPPGSREEGHQIAGRIRRDCAVQ